MMAWVLAAASAIGVAALLRESFLGMLFQWRSSSTFSYGFLILPIAVFLVWRERDRLARIRPEPAWIPVVLMLPVGAVWVLGTALEVNVAHHFAAVILVILTVWAVLGTPVARVIWFPLAYLLLMVPFGEFLVPTLMQWTADFAVLGVSLSGVPVFQDGYVFSLPSGDFEVIKACSGIRFLMATVAAGTVFAWVAYRSWRKRLLFLLACLVVPVLGNLLRAYGVVMLVHLSEMRLAGAHILYGTLFFSAILLSLFVVGARYADGSLTSTAGQTGASAGVTAGAGRTAPAGVLAVAVVALLLASLVAAGPAVLRQRSLEAAVAGVALPTGVPGFRGPLPAATDWRPDFRGAAEDLAATYRPDASGGTVDLAIANYAAASARGELTDSRNRVYADKVWRRVGGANGDGFDEDLLRPAPGSGGESGTGRIVWSWYAVDGVTTSRRFGAEWLELRGLLRPGARQRGRVAVSTSFDGEPRAARKLLGDFLAGSCPSGLPCPGQFTRTTSAAAAPAPRSAAAR